MSPVSREEGCICGSKDSSVAFTYDAPPAGETPFAFTRAHPYFRTIVRCTYCGHFRSTHALDVTTLYTGDYVSANYPEDGIRRAFERVNALDPAASDNVGRVRRVVAFALERFGDSAPRPTLLDVGSGIGVFVHRMRAEGWECVALDPDERAVRHAREVVGVRAIQGDFLSVRDPGAFDVITFNRVLEHVPDPVAMLSKARAHLAPGGLVYIELPDGERAAEDGPGREEFFIDHLHIFSPASTAVLVHRAGLRLSLLERLVEPSGKYTIRAFLIPGLVPIS